MTIFFIRHGETLYNEAGQVTGQRDVPLGPRGRDQAAAAGRELSRIFVERGLIPEQVPFLVSTLERARMTAEIVRQALGLDPQAYATDARLMELSLGAWEGLTMAEVGARHAVDLAARKADPWAAAPTGGETYRQLAVRAAAALASVATPCVIVAHAGTGRAILSLEGGVEPPAAARIPIQQGRILVIENHAYSWR